MSPVSPALTARLPRINTYIRNEPSATPPIPILAHVGSGDGVTNASMTPETASTTIMPSTIVTVARPSSASARDRGRGPGSMTVQPSRRPAAAARKTADSSSMPCGKISAKNSVPRPFAIMKPPSTPRFSALSSSTSTVGMPSRMPEISASAATNTLFVQTLAANEVAAYCE